MIDIDREIRATLDERAGLAPPPVDARLAIRVARRRQLGVVLTALVAVAALVLGSIAGVSALMRSSERRVPIGPVETPSVSIGPVAACPPGSTPDEPGPVDQPRPSARPGLQMAFDRDSGRIVLLGYARGSMTTWTFDVCTNTWHRMSPQQEPEPRNVVGGSGSGHLIYDADSDLTIAVLPWGEVWAYDLESDTWTEKGRVPGRHPGDIRLAYDPESGLVVLRQLKVQQTSFRARLWTYDVDTDVWVEIHDVNVPASEQSEYQLLLALSGQFVYDASVGRFVGFGTLQTPPEARAGFVGLAAAPIRPERRATWTFDLPTATWSLMQASPPALELFWFDTGGEAAYDEAAGMTVVSAQGFVGGYDASADRWVTLYASPQISGVTVPGGRGCCPPGPLNRLGHQIVYDPVNERLVVYGGSHATRSHPDQFISARDVWAFDVATREWTRLLAPSDGSE